MRVGKMEIKNQNQHVSYTCLARIREGSSSLFLSIFEVVFFLPFFCRISTSRVFFFEVQHACLLALLAAGRLVLPD
jgi:hypothetical protein